MNDIKQEVEKIGSAYAESFNRQDATGIAALYADDGMHINPEGHERILNSSTEAYSKLDLITKTSFSMRSGL
ncbi:nuclear transport factor 2 family protein [Bradyrhizobium jicamae]|uniref:Nuclear transport factor 2 family protein n=1 Tax=Bradyrhizobium jicamae TaxID=280332 RepID=A0ABS5FYG5_9BRAD|nr:nuclear transport factor 2 family protein [Bradyrhizobium jicamae]MBR0801869.1 nuclear transport factor 2 family protein [Bradyrhizobium jicamae]